MLACTAFSFPVGASAAVNVLPFDTFTGVFMNTDGNVYELEEGYCYYYGLDSSVYEISFNVGDFSFPVVSDGFYYHSIEIHYVVGGEFKTISYDGSSPYILDCSSFDIIDEVEFPYRAAVLVNSVGAPPVVTIHEEAEPLYYSAFEMFANFIYGEGAELTAEQNMVLTILATSAALACVLLPFLIVFGIARRCGL